MAELSTSEMTVTPRNTSSVRPFLQKVRILGRDYFMLIDWGASHCVLSTGRGFDASRMHTTELVVHRFDGQVQQRTVPVADLEVVCEGPVVQVPFVFWPLNHDYDGILGRTWLEASNPSINWSTRSLYWPAERQDPPPPPNDDDDWPDSPVEHQSVPVSDHSKKPFAPVEVSLQSFRKRLKNQQYLEIFQLVLESGVLPKPTPREIVILLNDFDDVFPSSLPNELPPEREVQHHIQVKPNAVPSSRSPFHHARVEEQALAGFVKELHEKNNIEESNSAS
ncbi:unnamed protein product [Phytophthora fragariaefolia]|uniref:Unnamed protein product n=1 Tax=Phytophthora fragariaefolia TaxID=1490495 RepID=A0A9W7D6D0_9STRA|nr:unnamed protein product [Phytophthora fragariaefolia]